MKRWLTFVFVLAVAVALGGVMSRVPRALSEVEAFRVREIRLRGERFLTHGAAVESLDLAPGASVWDDTSILEERLARHPLIREASVHRRFPGALLVKVVEAEPVALFPNPTLEPVDAGGRILPIDPVAHKLDLPIVASAESEGPGSLTAGGLRTLAGEVHRLAQGDPELHARISDFTLNRRGDVQARLADPQVTLHFRPGLSSGQIHTGLRVLSDVRGRFDEGRVEDLDLRFENQVVVRLEGAGG
jgi:hypothetical protein